MAWLAEVEEKTHAFRNAHSKRLGKKSRFLEKEATRYKQACARQDITDAARADLSSEAERLSMSARWYGARSTGQIERFQRKEACGEREGACTCHHCGKVQDLRIECGVWRICMHCRGAQAMRRRARFALARAALLLQAQKAQLLRPGRHGGAWTEKLLTLTVPHFLAKRGDSVTARIDAAFEAWRLFSLQLQKQWRKTRKQCPPGIRRIYYRAFEWTPGSDRQGHPHFHVYLFCDFLLHKRVREWWMAALKKVARGPIDAEQVITDIRKIHVRPNEISRELLKSGDKAIKLAQLRVEATGGGNDVLKYADGWTLAEYDDGTQRIPSDTGARLYEALEARRSAQASRGFLEPKIVGRCWDCGETGYLVIQLAPEGARAARVDTRAQGPPESLEQVIAEASQWGHEVGSTTYEPPDVQRSAPAPSQRTREIARRLAIACRTLRPRRY